MGTISTDPIGFSAGDANLYRYVGNHGTYASDPSGLAEPAKGDFVFPTITVLSKEGQRRSFDDTVAAAKDALSSYESAIGQQLAGWQYENVIANSERYLPGIAEMELAEQQQHLSFTIPFLMDAEQSSLQFSAKVRAIQQAVGAAIYRSAFSGAASLDDLNSYLGRPVGLHEFNEYVQGTTNNAAWVASFGASDSLYITDTSKYTGWAWNGQRIAFTFAREATISAATAGSGTVVSAGRGGLAARSVLYAGRGYELYGVGQSGYATGQSIGEGNVAGTLMHGGLTLVSAAGFRGSFTSARVAPKGEGFNLLPFLHDTPKKLAGSKVVNVFDDVATDPRFLRIAGVNSDEMAAAVRSASIRYSNPFQGGFAGRVATESGEELVLGLSRFHVRRSPAAHELFHLSRDLRGIQTLSMDKIPRQLGRLREEAIVWGMQFRYAPVRTTLEGAGTVTIYVGVPVGVASLVGDQVFNR